MTLWTTNNQKPAGNKKAELETVLSGEELYGEQQPPPYLTASIKLVYLKTGVKPTPLSIGVYRLI